MPTRSVRCPTCGAGLEGTQGQTLAVCRFCRTEVRLTLTPIDGMTRALEKKAEVESRMNALMERYAASLVTDVRRALLYYEAFTYLVLWTSHEVEDLAELEAMASPLMKEAARQLKTTYVAPVDRGETVTFASVDALLS